MKDLTRYIGCPALLKNSYSKRHNAYLKRGIFKGVDGNLLVIRFDGQSWDSYLPENDIVLLPNEGASC